MGPGNGAERGQRVAESRMASIKWFGGISCIAGVGHPVDTPKQSPKHPHHLHDVRSDATCLATQHEPFDGRTVCEGDESRVDREIHPYRHVVGSDRLRGLENSPDRGADGRETTYNFVFDTRLRKHYATRPAISMPRHISEFRQVVRSGNHIGIPTCCVEYHRPLTGSNLARLANSGSMIDAAPYAWYLPWSLTFKQNPGAVRCNGMFDYASGLPRT